MGALRGMLAGALLSLAAAGDAPAGENLVVVELYTSQGCSSCPPADALLTELARRGDVLALALHVDYWDYIGWKDDFADPRYSERQKAYARVAGARSVYTPQMIVGGTDHLVGAKPIELGALIETHGARPPGAALSLTRSGARLTIRIEAVPGGARGRMVVQLVRFMPEQTVDIGRGENAGRTITYSNIVTDWREIGHWTGAGPLQLTADIPGPDRAAVILQADGPGPILAAALAR